MNRVLFDEGVADNLRFMILEVSKQVYNSQSVLQEPDEELIKTISRRDDYIDNLKSHIESTCFSAIHGQKARDKKSVDLLRAANTVCSNLERIADYAVNIVSQIAYLSKPAFIRRYDFDKFFREASKGLDLVHDALFRQDMALAFRICRCEYKLDLLYKQQFDRILGELKSGSDTGDLITSHLILRYLERMGDALLNIGEAVIFSILGEKFKIRQYEALKRIMTKSGVDAPISGVEFESIWGTRSGCRISRVASREEQNSDKGANGVLFKEGDKKKLLREKINIERWEEIAPGLPPKVLGFREEGGQASMLVEFLGGCTFQDVVLSTDDEILGNAMFLIEQTMQSAWDQTMARGEFRAGYVRQIRDRLDDVYRLHPCLRQEGKMIGGMRIPSMGELLDGAARAEDTLFSPRGVYIHGDFNINNIFYAHESQRIHYIDLHRSKIGDPLQDISVFLVSNFRLPVFDRILRARLNRVVKNMYAFARQWAEANQDETFAARLCLGLGRNFITSARFELNPDFASAMFLRGIYLLELINARKNGPWEDFVFPGPVLEF